MSRSRQKGTSFERQVVEYLRSALGDDGIERRAQSGANDRGDVAGLHIMGLRCVVECKNKQRMELAQWVDEAEAEKGNDDAAFSFVAHKRRGCGEKSMGGTYVTCTLETLAALAAGGPENLWEDE